MMSALLRVVVRAVEIQLEEAAATGAARANLKGKGRAVEYQHGRSAEEFPGRSVDPLDGVAASKKDHQVALTGVGSQSWKMERRVATARSSPTKQSSPSSTLPEDPVAPPLNNLARNATIVEDAAARIPSQEPTPSVSQYRAPPQQTVTESPIDQTSVAAEPPESKAETRLSTPGAGPSQPAPIQLDDLVTPAALDDVQSSPHPVDLGHAEEEDVPVVLRASKVPSSRLGRLLHYGSLAASMSLGAASESLRRTRGDHSGKGSVFMSDANVRRLVASLGRMRGAALKLGQFMSIQDNHMLPPEIEKVLQQVQAHANYMPGWQMEQVMSSEFGSEWQSLFTAFDRTPIASASIGQVHRAVLSSNGQPVAVKIQFPGIASSINSDLNNLSILLRTSSLLPKGMYLQNTIAVMRRELEDECDYVREGAAGKRFEGLLAGDDFFSVPRVEDEATTGKVLTTSWADGRPLSRMRNMSQETRDKIGTNILRLCLQELFHFRFMQTDPNWANFLYDADSDRIQLIDFGASREYTKEFMDGWYRLLMAALNNDRAAMKLESESLGYLTGEENDEMLNAHLDSMALISSPFSHSGQYEFANQTITDSVRGLIPIMLKHRLTPPPPETYSLNRKLSGAFLMCARLGSRVDCGRLWGDYVGDYKQG